MNEWKKVKIADILEPVKRPVKPEMDKKYPCLGIRLEGRSTFLRKTKIGIDIRANTLYQVKEGDFIYSRLFAWRGAFAIINKDFDGMFVSNEFPTFIVDKQKIDPYFLLLYFSRPKVLKEVENLCTGTTKASRNRFKEDKFLNMKITFPPPPKQKKIVEIYEKITEAKNLQHQTQKQIDTLMHSILDRAFREKSI